MMNIGHSLILIIKINILKQNNNNNFCIINKIILFFMTYIKCLKKDYNIEGILTVMGGFLLHWFLYIFNTI